MQVKPQTLMVAIQRVAAQIKAIDRRLQEEEPDDVAELEQLLVSFDLAAEDLKQAYLDALTKFFRPARLRGDRGVMAVAARQSKLRWSGTDPLQKFE